MLGWCFDYATAAFIEFLSGLSSTIWRCILSMPEVMLSDHTKRKSISTVYSLFLPVSFHSRFIHSPTCRSFISCCSASVLLCRLTYWHVKYSASYQPFSFLTSCRFLYRTYKLEGKFACMHACSNFFFFHIFPIYRDVKRIPDITYKACFSVALILESYKFWVVLCLGNAMCSVKNETCSLQQLCIWLCERR